MHFAKFVLVAPLADAATYVGLGSNAVSGMAHFTSHDPTNERCHEPALAGLGWQWGGAPCAARIVVVDLRGSVLGRCGGKGM